MRVAVTVVVVGLLLGVLDLVAQANLSYPWANLANSPAIWGLAAYGVGLSVGRTRTAVVAGAATLVLAAVAYYVSASVGLGDEFSNATSSTAMFWYAGGIAVGALGGLGGAWSRSSTAWQAVVGFAFPVALPWAEASVQYIAAKDRSGWNANTSSALVLGLIGLALAAVMVPRVAKRQGSAWTAACVTAVVILALVGHVAYRAVGLRGFRS